ncbi:MAG: S8 family serine peptidase [Chloroflexi bacterium]|nr:S8 family serine peptidase [Chloroflexota bacterium]
MLLLVSLICSSLIVPAHPALSQPTGPATPAVSGELPTDQIIIKYRSVNAALSVQADAPATLQRLSDAAAAPVGYVRAMTDEIHVLRLTARHPLAEVAAIADRLAKLPEVEYAEPDRILRPLLVPNDPQYTNQWHYFGAYGIDAPAAWDITTGSTDIVVAVIDTGILSHADLAGRTLPGYDFITDVFVANDGGGRDADPSDPGDWSTAGECYTGSPAESSSWHGTHVAGTIGAASNNNFGVAGINWVSKILPVRVLGKCGGDEADIIDAMRWAAGLSVVGVPGNPNPAKVLNLSLGGSGACGLTQQAAIDEIVAHGTTVVVAAGNSNQDAANFNPASCNNVVSVAATDSAGQRAYYSNFGSVVDIAAPGGAQSFANDPAGVLSTLNAGTTTPGADNYIYYQGTSMAAPHVAGIASLVVSLIPSATPAQVSQIMRNTVKAFPGGSTCNTSICGPGIASAFNSVNGLPRITDFSPKQVPMGSLTTTLTITGANFVSGSIVKWNSTNLATTYVNANNLTAVISTSLLIVPTVGKITVSGTHATYGSLTTAARSVVVLGDQFVYLPIIANGFKQTPNAPVLIAINNPASANTYSVVWNSVPGATSYTLQEDDNASFSSPATAYSGAGTSQAFASKPVGTYYYRVNAANAYGNSAWSVTRSTAVAGASNLPVAGFWESATGDEFYVTTDRTNVDDFAIYINVNGCGSYKITHTTPVPITSNQFSFTGSFYASGTFNSTTSASGQDGLSGFVISGCGTINGGPWNWSATWQHAALVSEPQITLGTVTDENGVTRTALIAVSHNAHAVQR